MHTRRVRCSHRCVSCDMHRLSAALRYLTAHFTTGFLKPLSAATPKLSPERRHPEALSCFEARAHAHAHQRVAAAERKLEGATRARRPRASCLSRRGGDARWRELKRARLSSGKCRWCAKGPDIGDAASVECGNPTRERFAIFGLKSTKSSHPHQLRDGEPRQPLSAPARREPPDAPRANAAKAKAEPTRLTQHHAPQ